MKITIATPDYHQLHDRDLESITSIIKNTQTYLILFPNDKTQLDWNKSTPTAKIAWDLKFVTDEHSPALSEWDLHILVDPIREGVTI